MKKRYKFPHIVVQHITIAGSMLTLSSVNDEYSDAGALSKERDYEWNESSGQETSAYGSYQW